MDPLLYSVLIEIRDELKELNSKLDVMQGYGNAWSIGDIYDKLSDIQNEIADASVSVCDKVSDIGCGYDIGDVCSRLDTLDTTISLKD